jgi:hypothetical protein
MVGTVGIVNALGEIGMTSVTLWAAINGFDPEHQFFALVAAQQGS